MLMLNATDNATQIPCVSDYLCLLNMAHLSYILLRIIFGDFRCWFSERDVSSTGVRSKRWFWLHFMALPVTFHS